MRALLQRVTHASVTVDGVVTGSIGHGLLIFLGVGRGDNGDIVEALVKKCLSLRIFQDEEGKINRSVREVGGGLLVVSQFTLYADTSRGNRPGFSLSAPPEIAEPLYQSFCNCLAKESGCAVQKGIFGADMKVDLRNDGPFTMMLEKEGALF